MAAEDVSYETLLDQLPDGVFFVDRQMTITYWNRGAERITGYARPDVIGQSCLPDRLGHVDRAGEPVFRGRTAWARALEEKETIEQEVFIRHREGRLVPVFLRVSPILSGLGEVIGALEVFSDNTSKLQAQARIEELEEMALVCPLTGVGNRRYSQLALDNAFEELKRYHWNFGLLFADVDHFKSVNDEFGHAVGDEVLRMVAHALRSTLRSFDFVGRWGGEEFIVLLPNVTDEILARIAERCRALIEDSIYQSEGKTVRVTVSIGGVLARADEAPAACIARADRLMYESKSRGRNTVSLDA